MYHILLLEDDPEDQLLIEMLLEDFADVQFEVEKVGNVAAASRCLQERHYDLLIVDWMLKGRSGTEYGTEFIKTWFRNGYRLPAILISGQAHVLLDAEILELISRNELQYINKDSLTPYVIVDAICNALSRVINVLIADHRTILPSQICAALNADRFYRFRPRVAHDLDTAFSLLEDRVFDIAAIHASLPSGTLRHRGAAQVIDGLLQAGRCEQTAFLMYGFSASIGNDEAALRLLGRRHISFCSEEHMQNRAIVPTLIQARNDILWHRHYRAAAAEHPSAELPIGFSRAAY